jgi:hypothetical protein
MVRKPPVSISPQSVEDQIVTYFTQRFPAHQGTIVPSTDLKRHFSFSDSAWANLADAFAELDWVKMNKIRVLKPEFYSISTLSQLTELMYKGLPGNPTIPHPKPKPRGR